jgi:hypothetical protein
MNDATLALDGGDATPASPYPTSVRLHGKEMRVELTPAAQRAAAALAQPLLVEMELFFSCLVRKQVRIKPLDDATMPPQEMVSIGDRLRLGFRPVVSEQCHIADLGDAAPPLQTMPVTRTAAYIPRWLRLDYRKGQWSGEFGYQG